MGSAAAAFEVDRSVMAEAYWSVWNDEAQAKIDADIERFRKADASIEVAAPDGTEVRVEQTRHAFFFGAHIFNFNQLGSKERNERYKVRLRAGALQLGDRGVLLAHAGASSPRTAL